MLKCFVGGIILNTSDIIFHSEIALNFSIFSSVDIPVQAFAPLPSLSLATAGLFIFLVRTAFHLSDFLCPLDLLLSSPRSKVIKQNHIPHVLTLQRPLDCSLCRVRAWLMALLHFRLHWNIGHRVPFDLLGAMGWLRCSCSWSDLPDGWCSVQGPSAVSHFFPLLISSSSCLSAIS